MKNLSKNCWFLDVFWYSPNNYEKVSHKITEFDKEKTKGKDHNSSQSVKSKESQQTFVLMKTSWRCLEGVFRLRHRKTSSRRLQDVLIKTNMFALTLRLQKTSSRRLGQDQYIRLGYTYSRRLQDVFPRRLQDVFKTSCKNVFKTSSRRIIKLNCSC